MVKGKMLSINTGKQTKSKVFFDWQLEVIASLERTGREPIGSRKVWEEVNQTEKISRASVINFLTRLHELDLIVGHRRSGKGGMRFNYTFHADRLYFDEQVVRLLLMTLLGEFGDTVNVKDQLLILLGSQ